MNYELYVFFKLSNHLFEILVWKLNIIFKKFYAMESTLKDLVVAVIIKRRECDSYYFFKALKPLTELGTFHAWVFVVKK